MVGKDRYRNERGSVCMRKRDRVKKAYHRMDGWKCCAYKATGCGRGEHKNNFFTKGERRWGASAVGGKGGPPGGGNPGSGISKSKATLTGGVWGGVLRRVI